VGCDLEAALGPGSGGVAPAGWPAEPNGSLRGVGPLRRFGRRFGAINLQANFYTVSFSSGCR
jgi:hypothetical protein